MPRSSRRDEIVAAALELFVAQGWDGTSVAEIAAAVGVSKAAVSYHFPAKDDLLLAIADEVLVDLEELVDARSRRDGPLHGEELRDFLERYVTALLQHAEVVTWLDSDRGVLAHEVVGDRIVALHEATRRLLGGGDDPAADVVAASALGAMWRPVRSLALAPDEEHTLLVDAALAALATAPG